MPDETARIATFIPKDVKADLKKLANAKGLTMSAYIRMLIIEDVNQKKDQKK